MIEKTEIEGRPASVAYLKTDFTPADKDDAELIKIIFDDGEVRFAVPESDETEKGTVGDGSSKKKIVGA
jgi:hypothetical protein